jgi:predicted nucleotidyltransferase
MKPSTALKSHRQEILDIVAQNHAINVRVFGSVLHAQDTNSSDLDLLIEPTFETTLMDIARIQNKLQVLLGVSVDVLTPNALPKQFRNQILNEAKPI